MGLFERPLRKVLYTIGSLTAGGILAFNACTSVPTPTLTPTRTPTATMAPTSIIQLHRQSIQPRPTLEPTQTRVSVATPTPAPSPAVILAPTIRSTPTVDISKKNVLVYLPNFCEGFDPSRNSKFKTLAWTIGIEAELFTYSLKERGCEGDIPEFKEKLASSRYSGVWVSTGARLSDSIVFGLSKFVKNGGRLFFELPYWECNKPVTESLRNYLNVSLNCEEVVPKREPYVIDGRILRLFDELTVGIDGEPMKAYFTAVGYSESGSIKSRETGRMRAVAIYGRIGDGEVILFLTPRHMGSDEYIDTYDNREATARVLRWIAREIEYPKK